MLSHLDEADENDSASQERRYFFRIAQGNPPGGGSEGLRARAHREFEALHGRSIITRGFLGDVFLFSRPWALFFMQIFFVVLAVSFSVLFLYLQREVLDGKYVYRANDLAEYYAMGVLTFGVFAALGLAAAVSSLYRLWDIVLWIIGTLLLLCLLHLVLGLVFFMFGIGDPKLIISDTYLYTTVICFAFQIWALHVTRARNVWEKILAQIALQRSNISEEEWFAEGS